MAKSGLLPDYLESVDAGTPFPNMDVNPFGSNLQGAMLEEVYKSALGCFVNGSEKLVSAAEHGDHADQYLRKAFNLSAERHQELLEQAQLGQKLDLALHVKVKRADNLIARKGHGKSNPYCKLAVVKAEQKQMLQQDLVDWVKEGTLGKLLIRQTDVKYDTLEPEWDQDVTIPLMDAGSGFLAVEIWDSEDETELKQMKGLKRVQNSFKELRGRNDFLGKAHISLEDLPPEGEDSWFDLQSHHANPRGRVQMKLHIINVGVAHKVALEHYEKLFEAVCTFEARWTETSSTPDSASLEAQDKWSPNWSGKMTPSAETLLSLFASQYSITQLEQSIVHLDSLLKYHQCYHVSLSAFQDIYTTLLSLQDELEQGMASENGGAALENLSQYRQKLCACTQLLSDEIRNVIRNHSAELIDNPNSSLEIDRLRQQIGLLKDLYQVKVFQMSLPPEEANLSEVVAKEIEHSCAHWYCLQEKKAKEESPSKLLAYLSLVQSVAAFPKTSREALNIIFAEVEVEYLETVYIAVEGQLARGLPDALSDCRPQDPQTTYNLYLSLKKFKSFSTFVSEQRHNQLKLTHFHVHFQGMVNGWIELAAQRFKDAAMQVAQTVEEEKTVTEEAKFSSTARDLIDLVDTEVCSFWKNLDWPVAAESFVYLTTLIKEVCSGIVMFSKERCRRLRQANFFSPTTDTFMATKKLCIALNDIEQVRQGMQELPEFIKWPSFREVMAAETSLEEADAADQALKGILSTMDQTILQELTSLTEHVAEKMRPGIKQRLQNIMQASTQDAVKEVISPLMTYLENNLRELRTSFIRSVFLKLLSHIWFALVEKMWKFARSTRNETVTFHFHHLLNEVLFGYFHAEGEGLAKEVMESKQYTLLAYRVMPTDKMIQQYCETLADFQTNAPNTKGNITVMVGYMTEKQAVELILVRASNLPPVTVDKSCDTYLKISLLLPGENFSTAGRQKRRVQQQSLNPVLDELFSFPATSQQHLQMQGAVLAIEVYSHGRLHNHTPIGVIVIRCKDIPILAQNTSPEDNELAQEQPQKLTLTLPIFAPFDSPALNELSQRDNDAVAIDFAKRMKKLKARQADQQTGQQTNQQDSCEEAEHSPP